MASFDLDVATVEEMNPEGAMEVQNLRALGMGWAWCVNDPSKYPVLPFPGGFGFPW